MKTKPKKQSKNVTLKSKNEILSILTKEKYCQTEQEREFMASDLAGKKGTAFTTSGSYFKFVPSGGMSVKTYILPAETIYKKPRTKSEPLDKAIAKAEKKASNNKK